MKHYRGEEKIAFHHLDGFIVDGHRERASLLLFDPHEPRR
jgi:hypothetical protein